ncbi:MAG: S-methyl-5'-thioadenosine phosphorylase [Chloroflexota bacterium]|nr:S-methyl-5'-thioadenosine phosphorylase [Chloroflexota bacterium]MDE2884226.1 S-methyl-5'-thioadenosine phosphorylase [Chloroflexota bacterium]
MTDLPRATVGIIGGTGLYDIDMDDVHEVTFSTPYGEPSGPITIGRMGDVAAAFLPRHGAGHRISPTELNSMANIHAFKQLGVERVVSVSAVGSLQEDIAPLHMVVPDQLIDRTRLRENTFFGNGLVAHISFADPFCPDLSALLANAVEEDTSATVHRGGALVVIEGPAFSTRAESALYRSWGASIIGMTALPEARLAREAEMCYATLACATDYDVWHDEYASVTVEVVIQNLQRNVAASRETLRRLIPRLGYDRTCDCRDALHNAIVTPMQHAPQETLERLGPIVSRYIKQRGA